MKIKAARGKYTEYILSDTDEELGNTDTLTLITIRLANPSENTIRYNTLHANFYDLVILTESEVFLTLSSCSILDDQKPLFKFNQDFCLTDEAEFLRAWAKLPPLVTKEIHECVLNSNPSWAKELEMIEKIRGEFNTSLMRLGGVINDINDFDPEVEVSFTVKINIDDSVITIQIPPD